MTVIEKGVASSMTPCIWNSLCQSSGIAARFTYFPRGAAACDSWKTNETKAAETMRAEQKTEGGGKKARRRQKPCTYTARQGPREQSATIKYDEAVAIKPRRVVSRVFAENPLAKTHRLKDEQDAVHSKPTTDPDDPPWEQNLVPKFVFPRRFNGSFSGIACGWI